MAEHTADQDTLEEIKVGYQKAIDLWTYEGQLIWARFNAMLVANTIIVTILGFFANKKTTPHSITIVLSTSGVLLCLTWYVMMKRGFSYYKYWIFSARELEQQLSALKTVSRGGAFAEGKPVSFEFDGRTHTLRMGYFGRRADIERLSSLTVLVFLTLFGLAFIQAFVKS